MPRKSSRLALTSPRNRPEIKNVTIIGVGLIGGSLGLAIRRNFPSVGITGVDKPTILRKAAKRGAIDSGTERLDRSFSKADLVFLSTSTLAVFKLLPFLAQHVPAHSIVTDVGSVKTDVMRLADGFFPHGNFVGGHPMAGVEHSGIDAADALMFENAVYVLTPSRKTPSVLLRRLSAFVSALGAHVMSMDAETHDKVTSAVSHLPQLTAVALMNVVGKKHIQSHQYLRLAAGGFRDLTRVASSRFQIWESILTLNKKEVTASLGVLIDELKRYSDAVEKGNLKSLRLAFESGRRLRNSIPPNMKGFRRSLPHFQVYLPDEPGMLAILTTTLAEANMNVKDIELLKVREGVGGTFRISFESQKLSQEAARLLRRKGFEVST